MKEINNHLMEITKKNFTVKTVIVFLICLVLLFLFSSWMKNHSTDKISKNRQQEILKFKNNISEDIQEICDYNSDIIWLNTIDEKSQLYYNINTKGVVIYE